MGSFEKRTATNQVVDIVGQICCPFTRTIIFNEVEGSVFYGYDNAGTHFANPGADKK